MPWTFGGMIGRTGESCLPGKLLQSRTESLLTATRLTHVITDDSDRIIIVLVGETRGHDAQEFWKALFARLSAKLSSKPKERPKAFSKQSKDTANRGDFCALNFGVSYGGGNLVRGLPDGLSIS